MTTQYTFRQPKKEEKKGKNTWCVYDPEGNHICVCQREYTASLVASALNLKRHEDAAAWIPLPK